MGQKVSPIGFRVGITKAWHSDWVAFKEFPKFLYEDIKIRELIKKRYMLGTISRIKIERAINRINITIYTARPAVVIGRRGQEIEALKKELSQYSDGKEIMVDVQEIKKPELDAQLVAENVAFQIEKRVSYRRAMKRAVSSAIKFGAGGIKISCAGRLAGAEIARREWYREGRVPLHTIRANIDYGFAEAFTKMGMIGVKVWIYKGESFEKELLY
jgi:small subunit ribosomal protein S3